MLGYAAQSPRYINDAYADGAAFASAQMHEQLKHTPMYAGLSNRLIDRYYFSTARPAMGSGTMVPVSAEYLGQRSEPALTRAWTEQLVEDTFSRGDQQFVQMLPMQQVVTNTPKANSFTRELVDPLTGQSTNFIAFSFVPQYATELEQREALRKAYDMGVEVHRRNLDNSYYWRAPGQSFRHAPQ